jgi:hypothetical protein
MALSVYTLQLFMDDGEDLKAPPFIQKQYFDKIKHHIKATEPLARQAFLTCLRCKGTDMRLVSKVRVVTDYEPPIVDMLKSFHQNVALVRRILADYRKGGNIESSECKYEINNQLEFKEEDKTKNCQRLHEGEAAGTDTEKPSFTEIASDKSTDCTSSEKPSVPEIDLSKSIKRGVAVDNYHRVLYADMEEMAVMRYGHKYVLSVTLLKQCTA